MTTMPTPFEAFSQLYDAPTSPETLKLRSPEAIEALKAQHWQLAQQRKAGELRWQLQPASGNGLGAGLAGGLAVLQTVVDDQPFLVDTLSLVIRNLGAAIDWLVHPILPIQRDDSGQLQAVGEGLAESFIHVEFEDLGSAAAYAKLEESLQQTFGALKTAVEDYAAMRGRITELAARLERPPVKGNASEFAEARDFLRWLDERHFTFMGCMVSRLEHGEQGSSFKVTPQGGLGLLRAGSRLAEQADLIAPQEEVDKYAASTRIIVITKANQKSPIFQPEWLDVISIKLFSYEGTVVGTLRFIGLFTHEVYQERPSDIPLVRRKVERLLARSQLSPESHSGKHLKEILDQLPRDELFQSSDDELYDTCLGIRALRDRQQLRLFMRRDRYGRFYSCLVYLPRERYSRELRDKIEAELLHACTGSSVERNVEFLRGGLMRIHVTVRTPVGTVLSVPVADLEQRLISATKAWKDRLLSALPLEKQGLAGLFQFANNYTETVPAEEAVQDIQKLAGLTDAKPVLPRLSASGLRLYSKNQPVPLSVLLPVLENFGLKVQSQHPFEAQTLDGRCFIQHCRLEAQPDLLQAERFEQAFVALWQGEAENDGFNKLVLAAGLTARQAVLLRALGKYLLQTNLPYPQSQLENTLASQPKIALLLVQAFEAKFDPALSDRSSGIAIAQALDDALDKVSSLDADRILRGFVAVIRAALRTNFYQGKPAVSIKLDPSKINDLPLPKPMFEVWVYAPEVEGIHLRGGKVARGGLRWSDRRSDFRTEVLGLMKAQQVKNTVIVPVGAKGGFVLKTGNPSDREGWAKLGVAGYQTFVRSLLDITDNRVGEAIVPPVNVVRYDGDDPYLVVAADKGTATFSDIANALSAEYGFWLGDAFASGGSAGYDHKKMGITAKGGWESVKRHFAERGKDIQAEAFTVVGIGDMSGDVFGNGMLLSPHIHLLAAFDHRHIFLDPNPDAELSFLERQRLFALPRSSWEDYDKTLISAGGGVYPRSAKSIALSPEVQAALGTSETVVAPALLMQIILKAPVDLLWNGGIGTYIKASSQSHLDVGDRANDALRVNGKDLRCKVIGEGGNLGCTQLGRIEAALHGVALNTDAIDNAGGVHSSDREVNIKIPLNALMQQGLLSHEARDPLLASMTDDIVRFVLRDNFVQSAAVSMLEQQAVSRLDEHAELMRTLEREGLLNRTVEFLPDEESLKERQRNGQGLTRPELSVLLAYAKMSLFSAMLDSDMPDDPHFERDLLDNFPPALVERFPEALKQHQLKREIIATILSNAVVNRMGVAFAHRMAADHGHGRGEVLKAYALAHEIFQGDAWWQAIEALPSPKQQYKLMALVCGLLKHVTGYLVMTGYALKPMQEALDRYGAAVKSFQTLLPQALPASYQAEWRSTEQKLRSEGVPEALSMRLANTKVLGAALDVIDLGGDLPEATQAYFAVGEHFGFPWLYHTINNHRVQGKWHALARQNLRDDSYHIQRLLAARVLKHEGGLAGWLAQHQTPVLFALARIQEVRSTPNPDFESLVVVVRELRKLRGL
jgi:glutamate dehydrogenase